MSDLRQQTIDAYNESAKERSADFTSLGSQADVINDVLSICGNNSNPKVLEIGCGDGRDAGEIINHTSDYIGFDISEELIKIARNRVPGADFKIADATTFDYPNRLDAVFAFASLLHLSKEEIGDLFTKVHDCLNTKGVFYMTLKLSDHYRHGVEKDKYGTRQFFYYSPQDIEDLASEGYKVVSIKKTDFSTGTGIKWFNIILQKK